MEQLAGRPHWRIPFDEDGARTGPAAGDMPAEVGGADVRDLFVVCHGWNTDRDDAEALYGDLLPLLVAQAGGVPGLGPVATAGVHWPAIWFPDRPGPAGGGRAAGPATPRRPTAPVPAGRCGPATPS